MSPPNCLGGVPYIHGGSVPKLWPVDLQGHVPESLISVRLQHLLCRIELLPLAVLHDQVNKRLPGPHSPGPARYGEAAQVHCAVPVTGSSRSRPLPSHNEYCHGSWGLI